MSALLMEMLNLWQSTSSPEPRDTALCTCSTGYIHSAQSSVRPGEVYSASRHEAGHSTSSALYMCMYLLRLLLTEAEVHLYTKQYK